MNNIRKSRNSFFTGLFMKDQDKFEEAVHYFCDAVFYDPDFEDGYDELFSAYRRLPFCEQEERFDDLLNVIEIHKHWDYDIDFLTRIFEIYFYNPLPFKGKEYIVKKLFRNCIERISIEKTGSSGYCELIDTWRDYQLFILNLKSFSGVYLKMRNPSTGAYHVEGVPQGITSCIEALKWRVGGRPWNPEQLT